MKKKIKDLTLEELSELCFKQRDCNKCPMYNYCINYGSVKPYRMKTDYCILQQEIEVEE